MPSRISTTPTITRERFTRETLAQNCTSLFARTFQTHPCATRARGIVREAGKYYECAVAAAAATFLAALAAFAAVDALRRLLVFGGVAGASPISSAVIMLVTNSFGP